MINTQKRFFVDDATARKLRQFGLIYCNKMSNYDERYSVHGSWLQKMLDESPLVVAVEVNEETHWAKVTFKQGVSKIRQIKKTLKFDMSEHEEKVIDLEYIPLFDKLHTSSKTRNKRDGYCFDTDSGLSLPAVVMADYLEFIGKAQEIRSKILS